MDLSSMLNDGPAPRKEPFPGGSTSAQHQFAPSSQGHVARGTSGPSSHQPLDNRSGSAFQGMQPRGLTPLQTPTPPQQGSQYPFAPLTSQPSAGPTSAHPNAPQPAYGGLTSGNRSSSHGYSQHPPTPSQSMPAGISQVYQSQASTISPTPSSHHSLTPHSVRQSPLSTLTRGLPPQGAQPHYQHSQPNTPLGPPPLHYHRSSVHGSHSDAQSPYQQRTLSNPPNGLSTVSPAQRHPSIGNLSESPSAYNRPSPHTRRTSDYLANPDRERSVSVSPKTVVETRPPSHSSRQSSVHEAFSARNSIPASATSQPDAQSHVLPQPQQRPSLPPHIPHSASDVSQQLANHGTVNYNAQSATATSPQNPIQNRSEKMGMNNLLTPVSEYPPDIGSRQNSDFFPSQSTPASIASQHWGVKQEASAMDGQNAIDNSQRHIKREPTTNGDADRDSTMQTLYDSRKRPAENDLDSSRPSKRERTSRRYKERPIWAQLSSRNPKFDVQTQQNGGHTHSRANKNQGRPQPQSQPRSEKHEHQPSQPADRAASAQATHVNFDAPWLNPIPFDMDLVKAREVLGSWEKSIKWNTPYPDLLRAVQDWIIRTLYNHQDLGQDPSVGAFEIEAKIGRLVSARTGERAKIPVFNTTVLDPAYNRDYRFESEMEEGEFQCMNKFLNDTIRDTMQPGRVTMEYKHIHETDSFASLSPAGHLALPPGVRNQPLHGRELKLRTTHDDKTGQVKARIVKVPLGDLHLLNPSPGYDCRISINLEVNLLRPDIDSVGLAEPPSENRPTPPSRKKDRLSYKHLAYQIDLTKVDVKELASKYELEVEVDAHLLMAQIALVHERRPNAYGDVISGFLDNVTFLMRQQTGK